jgi:type IV pilus assembly protein PilY1
MDRMRFALMSYLADNNQNRDGGVLREKMKWVNPTIGYGIKYHDASGNPVTCTNSAGCDNPEKEVAADGTFVNNPDGAGSGNSGLINYINKFAYSAGYKSYDPAGEMYYEVLRYFRNLTPSVSNYCSGATEPNDNFPVYCNATKTHARGWRDPAIYPCSQNYVIAINDANPWLDKRIPGSAFKAG